MVGSKELNDGVLCADPFSKVVSKKDKRKEVRWIYYCVSSLNKTGLECYEMETWVFRPVSVNLLLLLVLTV